MACVRASSIGLMKAQIALNTPGALMMQVWPIISGKLSWSTLMTRVSMRLTSPVRWRRPTPLTSRTPKVWSMCRPAAREHAGRM